MKFGVLVIAAGLSAPLGWLAGIFGPQAITAQSLSDQLEGAHCRFAFEGDTCTRRGVEPLVSLLLERHDCDFWAVQCLAEMDTPEARAVLVQVLKTKADVQTCDGVIPIRTHVVAYLGVSGDTSMIAPLRELLASRPKQDLSAGASGCAANDEDPDVIQSVISRLEGN